MEPDPRRGSEGKGAASAKEKKREGSSMKQGSSDAGCSPPAAYGQNNCSFSLHRPSSMGLHKEACSKHKSTHTHSTSTFWQRLGKEWDRQESLMRNMVNGDMLGSKVLGWHGKKLRNGRGCC